MEKLLTIVVPAYNVEKYIKNCLDSLIEISVLRSLEILVVNDGSTDRTLQIAKTYENKYPYSIKILSKENGGHGSAINYAIHELQESILRCSTEMTGWIRVNCQSLLSC